MSYILDALRRADSERERERSAVPGLHAQAVPAGAPDVDGEATHSPWRWPIVAAFVGLLGVVAWLWFDRGDGPKVAPALAPPSLPAVVPPVQAAGTVASASAPAPAPALALASAATFTAPAVPSAERTATAGTASPREAAPAAARKNTVPPSPPAAPVTAARKGPDASSAAAKTALVTKASEPEAKVSTLAELPDDVRRELPPVTVSGSIYSKSAANRMLVINGQVFHEGDALATGLVLEQIRQKSAILRFRTYRYEITY